MISITILLKIVLMLDCYLLTQTALLMKLWNLFDFSNYSKDSNETNNKVSGKMKDVFGGVIVIEFVGLK